MTALLISSLLSIFNFMCFGIVTLKLMRISFGFIETLLIGLVVINILTTTLSLFFPINSYILVVLTGLSLFFFIKIKVDLKRLFSSLSENKFVVLLSISFVTVALLIASTVPDNYDTELYHFQAIKWIEEYSIVPGLANLHGRFGFNPNIFTLFALTSLKDLFGQEVFSVNFSIFSLLVFFYIQKLYSIFKSNGVSNLFLLYLFIFLIILGLPNLSSPSPDFLFAVISLFIFTRLFELSGKKSGNEFVHFLPVMILSVYLITIKLASIPILLIFIFIIYYFKTKIRKIGWLLFISFLIIFPWLARNVITSGWLIYPFPNLDLFSFDWKVPISHVIQEKNSITGWARVRNVRGTQMSLIVWIPLWWHKLVLEKQIILICSVVFPVLTIITQLLKKIKIDSITNIIICSSFFGVIFWFFLGPDWRFGQPFILVSALLPLFLLKSSFKKSNMNLVIITIISLVFAYYTLGKTSILLVFLLLFFVSKRLLILENDKVTVSFIFFMSLLFINYSKVSLYNMNISKINLSSIIIKPIKLEIPKDNNFKVYKIGKIHTYVPLKSDRCFDHCIPCTPYPNSFVVLRKDKLQDGFRYQR